MSAFRFLEGPVAYGGKLYRLTDIGGKLEFISDVDEMIRRALEHIDLKRAALGLPEYDPGKFGRSGDARMLELEALPLEERRDAIYGAAGQ